jgi:hypothetical protein
MTTELSQKASDKLDKFRDHLLHRIPLKPSEHETLGKYRKYFAWRCKLFSPHQHLNVLLTQDYSIKCSYAY